MSETEQAEAASEGAEDITTPEVVEEAGSRGAITEPGKLLRIAVMLRELQEEVRRADPDDGGLERLRVVHDRAVEELSETLSDDLREELSAFTLPFDEVPSASEIRIAQASLVGWLEGLFQGIQMAIANQQNEARAQLEQMRGRGLPRGAGGGRPGQGGPGSGASGSDRQGPGPSTGQYL